MLKCHPSTINDYHTKVERPQPNKHTHKNTYRVKTEVTFCIFKFVNFVSLIHFKVNKVVSNIYHDMTKQKSETLCLPHINHGISCSLTLSNSQVSIKTKTTFSYFGNISLYYVCIFIICK